MKKYLFLLFSFLYTHFLMAQTNLTVYVGSKDKKLYALDAQSGAKKWEFLAGNYIQSSPTVVNGIVYIGSYDGKLYALDAQTGIKKWEFLTGNNIDSSPTVSNNLVYVGSIDNKLYALDAQTGTKKWEFLTGKYIDSSPTIANGIVYVGSGDDKIYAIDAQTGAKKWEFLTTSDISSSPTLVNGVVYVGGYDNILHAIDAQTGTKKWGFIANDAIYSSPAVANNIVYIGSLDNKVYAIDSQTGNKKWEFLTNSFVLSSPVVVNNIVYIGSWDNKIYALDSNTGTKKWEFLTGYYIDSSPTIANGIVYIGSWDNKIYALDSNTGTKKWEFLTGGGVSSSPCVVASDGKVYHSSISGYDDNTNTSVLSISPTTYTATSNAFSQNLTLQASANWSAQSNAAWLTVSPTSGVAGSFNNITYSGTANTSTSQRVGIITFTSGTATATLTVTQAGVPQPIKIENLPEAINQVSYTVPREATVHHYFLAKNSNTNLPVQNIIIQYTLSTSPNTIRQSFPSDSDGIIDLNIKIGGEDPNLSSDDWQGVGSVTVNFHSLANGVVPISNVFALNSAIPISVVNKAQPESKEYGFGVNFAFGQELGLETKFNIGGLKIGAGAASCSYGMTSNPLVTIIPISNDLWNVKINGSLGIFGSGEAGANGELDLGIVKSDVKVGPNASLSVDAALRDEIGYEVNLNDDAQLLRLAQNFMILQLRQHPKLKIASNFFKNILNNLQNTILPINTHGNYTAYNANGELSFELAFNTSFKKWDRNFYLGGGVSVEGAFNYETGIEVGNSQIIDTQTITTDIEGQAGFSFLGLKTGEEFLDKYLPIKIFSQSQKNEFGLEKVYNSQNILQRASISLSTENDEDFIFGKNHKISYINTFEYEKLAIDYLSKNYAINNNSIASYLIKNKTILPSFWSLPTNPSNIYSNMLDVNDYLLSNYQSSWNKETIKQSKTRDVTVKSGFSFPLEVSAGYGLGIEIGYDYWNTYSHKFQESVYLKDLNRRLVTLDYPDVTNNIEIPVFDPIQYFWNKVQSSLNNLSSTLKQTAYSFVTERFQSAINLVSVFTNNNQARLSLSGKTLYDPKTDSKSANSSTAPSIFTFTVNPNPTVFSNNTSLIFRYYYPENEISAYTSTDTLQIISDIFFFEAKDGNQVVNQAPNGNFTISTQLSQNDLALASLPNNSVVEVLFLPNGSQVWEKIGLANQTLQFNRMGIFALGVKISNDITPPIISVSYPSTFVTPNYIEVILNETQSGIDWAKTKLLINGVSFQIARQGLTNTFRINISDLPSNSNGVFTFYISTVDLAGNPKIYQNVYPCDYQLIVQGLELDPDNPILRKAITTIQTNSKTPLNKDVQFRAGKSIELTAGFETKGKSFTAQIGGCITPTLPTNGLVLYLPFSNGSLLDQSGNNNNATNLGATLTNDRKGIANAAYNFGGFSNKNFIKVTNSASLQFTNEITISLWFSLNTYAGMTGTGQNATYGTHTLFAKDFDNIGFYGRVFADVPTNNMKLDFVGVPGPSNFMTFPVLGDMNANLNNWIHLVHVLGNGKIKTFKNGVLVMDRTLTTTPNFTDANTKDLYFGCYRGGFWYPLNGKLDDIRIYNRALTDQEVQNIYTIER